MSSILKALQKAEQEGSKFGNSAMGRLNIQRILRSKTNPKAQKKIIVPIQLSILLGAILVICIGSFLFFPTDKNISQKTDIQPLMPDASTEIKETLFAKKTTKSKPEPALPFEAKPMAEKLPIGKHQVLEESQNFDESPILEKNRIKEIKLPLETIAKIPMEETKKPSIGQLLITENMIEIKDDTLKIQAISWAKNPKDRIAVINNGIVEEKDLIMDYRIVQIQKDKIILNRSGKDYVLKFRYR